MPRPPKGTSQRRLTFTAQRKFPGLQGPRHWLRSSPDGSRIAFLMRDDAGIAQLWTVSPNGGAPRQVTRNPWSVASAFSWSPDGKHIACVMDHSVFLIDGQSGLCTRLTSRSADNLAPRPEACVFSPNGRAIAYVRRVPIGDGVFNQVFAVFIK
jgi:Tol biopolymer transport system component